MHQFKYIDVINAKNMHANLQQKLKKMRNNFIDIEKSFD